MVRNVVETGEEQYPLTIKLAQAIDELWRDHAVRRAYDRRAEFQLADSAK